MIEFKCICGKRFEMPDDRASDQFQCPECLRLVDVPGLGDVNSLDADGTVKLKETEVAESGLHEKMRIHGHHQDLRQSVDEYLSLDDIAPADAPPQKMPPRYDPITGELYEEIEIAPDYKPAPHEIPMATATLNYAAAPVESAPVAGEIRWWQAPWRILTGMSLMAMFFVFLAHVIVHFCLVLPGFNILLFFPAFLIVLAIIAHYGNTMEEIGPQNHDNVPVMLRQVSFSQDIMQPLYGMLVAGVICFSPLIVGWMFGMGTLILDHPPIWITLLLVAAFFFPAATFTAICSGAIQNLLPHHVFSVIRVAPVRYLLAWGAFMLAMAAYTSVIGGIGFASLAVFTSTISTSSIPWVLLGMTWVYGSMMLAVYLMHLSAVWMGLIYRTHHARFNWVYQEHQKTVRHDTLAQLAQMRRSGDPRLNRKIDPQRLAQLRAAEMARQAAHAEAMRKI